MTSLKNILLVDTCGSVCDFDDVRVIAVSTGHEALQFIGRYDFELIAAKWNLKDMPDGLLFERAKQMWLTSVLVAIVNAGNWQQELSARQTGANFVINDDYSFVELSHLIRELLGHKIGFLELKNK